MAAQVERTVTAIKSLIKLLAALIGLERAVRLVKAVLDEVENGG